MVGFLWEFPSTKTGKSGFRGKNSSPDIGVDLNTSPDVASPRGGTRQTRLT